MKSIAEIIFNSNLLTTISIVCIWLAIGLINGIIFYSIFKLMGF